MAETHGIFNPRTPGQFFKDLVGRFTPPDPSMSMFVLQGKQQADLSKIADMPRGVERREAAWQALVGTATASQDAVRPTLDSLTKEGLVQAYEGSALGNTLEVAVPTAKAKDFERAVKEKFGDFEIVTRVDPERPQLPKKGPKHVPTADEKDHLKHENDGPKDPDSFAVKDGRAWQLWQGQVDQLASQGLTGKGVTVGILDSGVDGDHPNLRHAIRGKDAYSWLPADEGQRGKADTIQDDGSHGTHVGGIIAGKDDELRTGVAPGAKLMVASMNRESMVGTFDWFLAPGEGDYRSATRDAKRGADIVNNSWGFVGEQGSKYGKALVKPLQQLAQAGVINVFAAGNSGPTFNTVMQPGIQDSVITVGAGDRDGTIAKYSSRDDASKPADQIKPDITAPGTAIPSSIPDGKVDGELALVRLLDKMTAGTVKDLGEHRPVPGTDGKYWQMSGTSMASPFTVGGLTLLLEKHPQLDTDDLKGIVQRTAVDMGKKGPDAMYGSGRLNLPAALAEADRMSATQSKA